MEKLIAAALATATTPVRAQAGLWDGPAVHVRAGLYSLGEYNPVLMGGRRLSLDVHTVGEPTVYVDGVTPRNAALIRRAKRAVELGLPVTVPEPEFDAPALGVSRAEFAAYAAEFRFTAKWGTKNFGPQVIGGTDDHPIYGTEDHFGPGFVFPTPQSGYANDGDYLVAYSPDGGCRYRAWFGGGSSGCSAHEFAQRYPNLVQMMDEDTRALLGRLAEVSLELDKELKEIRGRNSAAAESREREALAREFGVNQDTKRLYLVDVDEGLIEMVVREDGLISRAGEGTNWSLMEQGTLRIWEGDHSERGDRDEIVAMESPDMSKEFFSFDKGRAEARLLLLRQARERRELREELLKEHGLDSVSIEARRRELLKEHDLLDE